MVDKLFLICIIVSLFTGLFGLWLLLDVIFNQLHIWYLNRKSNKALKEQFSKSLKEKLLQDNERLIRTMNWELHDSLRYAETELYCPEHDGPKPDETQKAHRDYLKEMYIKTGDEQYLINKW